MAQTLAIIHTSPTLTPMFTALCAAEMPEVQIFHMVDESLIKETVRAGSLQRSTMRRLLWQVESAVATGVDAVLVTCSSIGPGVAIAQQLFDTPVIRIDDAMAEEAVRLGRRIGVAATLSTTMTPTVALLQAKAAEIGKEIEIVEALAAGAFDAVLSGDVETHDRILTNTLLQELQGVDLIVLAQASMARVVKALPEGLLRPTVLGSPELAVKRARRVLEAAREHAPVEVMA
jgi:Asp/Glu/hydantoin racemase